jgi:hemin uptake protein HemP
MSLRLVLAAADTSPRVQENSQDGLRGAGRAVVERAQMNARVDKSSKAVAAGPVGRLPPTVSSRDLLRGERLLIIKHEEETYRLQLTAAGKLILTK